VIALRFAAHDKAAAKLAAPLLEVARAAPSSVARAALYTLARFALDGSLSEATGAAGGARRAVPGRWWASNGWRSAGAGGGRGAEQGVLTTSERARAEAAATGLAARPDAGPALARALVVAPDADAHRCWSRLLRPYVKPAGGASWTASCCARCATRG